MNPKNQHCNVTSWNNVFIRLLKTYKKLVFKPNNGTGGDYLFLVNNEKQLTNATHKIFNRFDALTISPYVTIQNEYRLMVFKKTILLVYEKIRTNNE
jgi:glutathione synthase/RimK-type ligase-like ATP-grasp enzyme